MLRGPLHHQYFGFGPAAHHVADCPNAGTNAWEIGMSRRERYDTIDGEAAERAEVMVRLLCRRCGVVAFITDGTYHRTTVTDIGYGSKPERCGGMWLHAGPAMLIGDPKDQGPLAYYVTGAPEPPASEADVLGLISQHRTARGALRWLAGYGQHRGGGAITNTDEPFKTKRAAVAWITAAHAAVQDHPELADALTSLAEGPRTPQNDAEQAMPR